MVKAQDYLNRDDVKVYIDIAKRDNPSLEKYFKTLENEQASISKRAKAARKILEKRARTTQQNDSLGFFGSILKAFGLSNPQVAWAAPTDPLSKSYEIITNIATMLESELSGTPTTPGPLDLITIISTPSFPQSQGVFIEFGDQQRNVDVTLKYPYFSFTTSFAPTLAPLIAKRSGLNLLNGGIFMTFPAFARQLLAITNGDPKSEETIVATKPLQFNFPINNTTMIQAEISNPQDMIKLLGASFLNLEGISSAQQTIENDSTALVGGGGADYLVTSEKDQTKIKPTRVVNFEFSVTDSGKVALAMQYPACDIRLLLSNTAKEQLSKVFPIGRLTRGSKLYIKPEVFREKLIDHPGLLEMFTPAHSRTELYIKLGAESILAKPSTQTRGIELLTAAFDHLTITNGEQPQPSVVAQDMLLITNGDNLELEREAVVTQDLLTITDGDHQIEENIVAEPLRVAVPMGPASIEVEVSNAADMNTIRGMVQDGGTLSVGGGGSDYLETIQSDVAKLNPEDILDLAFSLQNTGEVSLAINSRSYNIEFLCDGALKDQLSHFFPIDELQVGIPVHVTPKSFVETLDKHPGLLEELTSAHVQKTDVCFTFGQDRILAKTVAAVGGLGLLAAAVGQIVSNYRSSRTTQSSSVDLERQLPVVIAEQTQAAPVILRPNHRRGPVPKGSTQYLTRSIKRR